VNERHGAGLRVLQRGQFGQHLRHRRLGHLGLLSVRYERLRQV
jgi:hypothetical protein